MKNHKTTPILIALFLISIFLTSGCTTIQPNKTFVRRGQTYSDTMPTVDRMGLLVDGVVNYDQVSTNYFDIADSLVAISNLTHETEVELKAKGYEIAFVEAPFVGGFKNAGMLAPVASGRKTEPKQKEAPFQTANYINDDTAYREALLTTSRQVLLAVNNHDAFPSETLQSSPEAKSALALLAAKKDVRYLFVVQGNGVIVSGGKQTGQAIGSGLFTAVMTLGTVYYSVHNVSFLDSYVSLIDLKNAEVIWCNSLRLGEFNPASSSQYQNRWTNNVLYWFPPHGKLEPPLISSQKTRPTQTESIVAPVPVVPPGCGLVYIYSLEDGTGGINYLTHNGTNFARLGSNQYLVQSVDPGKNIYGFYINWSSLGGGGLFGHMFLNHQNDPQPAVLSVVPGKAYYFKVIGTGFNASLWQEDESTALQELQHCRRMEIEKANH